MWFFLPSEILVVDAPVDAPALLQHFDIKLAHCKFNLKTYFIKHILLFTDAWPSWYYHKVDGW